MNQDKNSPCGCGHTHRLSSQKWPSVEAMFRLVRKTHTPDVMPVGQVDVRILKFLNDYLRHGRCKLLNAPKGC